MSSTAQRLATVDAPSQQSLQVPCRFASSVPLSTAELAAAPVRAPRPSRLQQEVHIGSPKADAGLKALGLTTVGALLEHVPRRLRDARAVAELRPGEQATIAVQVRSISSRQAFKRGRRKLMLVEATVFDDSGTIAATFFNQPWLVRRYTPGTKLLLHGSLHARKGFAVSHHAPTDAAATIELDRDAHAVGHYPATEGLSSTQILTLVRESSNAIAEIVDPLPARLRHKHRLPEKAAAIAAMHFPACRNEREAGHSRDEDGGSEREGGRGRDEGGGSKHQDGGDEHQGGRSRDEDGGSEREGGGDEHQEGRRRLAFEELLLAQLMLQQARALRASQQAPCLSRPRQLTQRWLRHTLPFTLTAHQAMAIEDIDKDLAVGKPMQRLLLGEVGSGKTVVALYAMLRAVEHDMQAALMAPTETLAEQHFAVLQTLLPHQLVSCALLTSSTPAKRKRDTLSKLASGELKLLVGTHALIEDHVRFAALGVAVVDEQHRFGVAQRAALAAHRIHPHVLHLSATPIPRTLWLTRYGDLDITRLRQLPSGRLPVRTVIASTPTQRAAAYAHIRAQAADGKQAFVVCPLVEESQQQQARAAIAEHKRLCEEELKGLRLGLLHGQMPAKEKRHTMLKLAAKELDVLVATTVIEVGVDVADATVILIEDAERYGISQLHQLRGRVGRGRHPSLCLLIGDKSSKRLRAVAEHQDGFELAEIDLALRGEGDLQGDHKAVRQSGRRELKFARLPEDASLLQAAHTQAAQLLEADPQLAAPEHALLRDALKLIPA